MNVVDLVKCKFVCNIELFGCVSLIFNFGVGFLVLCLDGMIVIVVIGGVKLVMICSVVFFLVIEDLIFDNFVYDKVKGEMVFVSYIGKVYIVKIGV